MPTLLLRLNGPLQSWGSGSYYDNRETDEIPSKSGILGIIAAALGRKRGDSLNDLMKLTIGVRIDAHGRRIRDFQITDMGEKLNANLSNRVYLSDATFLAGVYSENIAQLYAFDKALRNPVFTLYLGRRSCPPTLPLSLGIREKGLYDALYEEEWLIPQNIRRSLFGWDESIYLRIIMEDEKTGYLKRDVPFSYSPFKREYGYRFIKEWPGKKIVKNLPVEETDHDAFGEVGE